MTSARPLEKGDHLYLIDGSGYLFRAYHALPPLSRKSDGLPTYLLADIAYHRKKLARGFDQLCDIWGADHHGHIPRMQAALKALGANPDRLSVILIQMVSLLRDGKPVAMGKREGEFVTLDAVVDEVGRDATRFFYLMRRHDTPLEFDLELAGAELLGRDVARICPPITLEQARTWLTLPRLLDLLVGHIVQTSTHSEAAAAVSRIVGSFCRGFLG